MLILCLDSSDSDLRTAIFDNERLLAKDCSDSRGNHSREIIIRIDRMLAEAGKSLRDINVLSINLGPGSFTGLRIGLAAMAGFSLSAKIPLIGSTAFEIGAEDMRTVPGNYLMLIPCRSNEFYASHFRCSDEKVELVEQCRVIKPDQYEPLFDKTILIGAGAGAFYEGLATDSKINCITSDIKVQIPGLGSQAILAGRKSAEIEQDKFEIPELFYIAPSQAEVNYARRRAGR